MKTSTLFLLTWFVWCSVHLVLATRPCAAADWEHFLGPNGYLVSKETAWRDDWKTRAPKNLWRAQVGTGFSAVSVSRGLLYTLGYKGGKDTVWCLDAESGKKVWSHTYRCKLVDNLHDGGPAATPTVDGDRVFTCSKEGHLFAFEPKTGRILWQADLRQLGGSKMPEWGFSGSPTISGNALYVGAGPLLRLDKTTGKLIWKTRSRRSGYGSPTIFDHGGKSFVAWLDNEGLLVATADGGREVAFHPWKTQYKTSASTPIFRDGKLFISTGYNRGCALFEFTGSALKTVYEKKSMRNHMNNCVLIDGYLYGFDGNEHSRRNVRLSCIEWATGNVRWFQRGLGCGALMAAGNRLVVLGDRGELAVVAASPEGYREITRTKALSGTCWTIPVLSNGRVYCRNSDGEIACLDVRK